MKTLLIAVASLGFAAAASAAPAFADEVIIHRDAPAVVETPAPSSSTTTVEKHEGGDGCASKTVHKENDAGDSKTVHTENCD